MKTSVILHTAHSEFSPEQMIAIAKLAEEIQGSMRLVSSGLQIYNITKEDKENLIAKLPVGVVQVKHKAVNAITACMGAPHCKNGFMETLELAKYLEEKQYGRPMPHKLRIGIAGCPRCCSDPKIKDIGVYGLPTGYVLTVGGTSGGRPKGGYTIAKNLSVPSTKKAIDFLLDWYEQNAMPKEHFSHLIERLGNPLADSFFEEEAAIIVYDELAIKN